MTQWYRICLQGSRLTDLILGSGGSPGEGNGNPLQYSCLGNPMTEEPGGLQSKGSQSDTTYRSAKHIGGGRLSDTPDSSKRGPPIPEGLDMQVFWVPHQMPPVVLEAGK